MNRKVNRGDQILLEVEQSLSLSSLKMLLVAVTLGETTRDVNCEFLHQRNRKLTVEFCNGFTRVGTPVIYKMFTA